MGVKTVDRRPPTGDKAQGTYLREAIGNLPFAEGF